MSHKPPELLSSLRWARKADHKLMTTLTFLVKNRCQSPPDVEKAAISGALDRREPMEHAIVIKVLPANQEQSQAARQLILPVH